MKARGLFLLAAWALPCAEPAAAQAPGDREFSLNDRVFLSLTPDWVERREVRPPPAPPLATSAPTLRFSDVLILENRATPAVVQLLLSDNPYTGQDSRRLQTDLQIHAGAIRHFFYFFFPPPRGCLARAAAMVEKAQRDAEAEAAQKEKARESDPKETRRQPPASVPPIAIFTRCDFGPEPRDFFAEQVSPGVRISPSPSGERVDGQLRRFFLPAMEEIQIGEMTLVVFEAQAEATVGRAEIEKYGLPDDMAGAHIHYFWALAARTPFPFLADPHRKDQQPVHVVLATVSRSGDARPVFLDLLRRLRFTP